MKRLVSVLLVLLLAFSMVACGGNNTANNGGNAANNGGNTAGDNAGGEGSGYTGGEYTLVVASHVTEDVTAGSGLIEFCNLVETYSDGKIKCELYTDGQLGTQSEAAAEVRTGGIDICLNDWPTMASTNGFLKGNVVSLGYMFQDYDHVMAFYESDIMAQMVDELIEQCGVRCLASCASGFRNVFTQKPITGLEDMNGLRIRVPDIEVYVDTFQALGCATTIVANSEVYTALQTGIVDSVENPNITVYSSSWYEQLGYMTKTNHIWCDLDYFMNEETYQSLDDAAKAVIDQAAKEAQAYGMEYSEESETTYEELLLGEGGLELCEVDITPFREAVQDTVWADFESTVDGGAEMIEAIQALAA